MGKKPDQRKKQNLLREFKLSSMLAHEPSMEQIGRMLTQEMTSEPKTQAMKGKRKPRKAKAETHAGRILIVRDAPVPAHLIQWLTGRRYQYTLVNNEEEAVAYLDRERFDCVVYGHEFQI